MARAEEALRAQKDANQKKLLFVLVPVFLALVVWQGPKTYKAFSGSSAPVSEPVPTTSTPAPSIDPSSAPAPSTATGAPQATRAGSSGLSDTDPLPAADSNQVASFSLFGAQDPFLPRSGAPLPYDVESASTDTSGTTDGGTTDGGTTDGGTTATGTDASGSGSEGTATSSASLDVNGSQARVALGSTFPKSDPLFRVTKIGSDYIRVGLVSGSFLNGSSTQKIKVGHSLTLLKQPEGVPFKVTVRTVSFVAG